MKIKAPLEWGLDLWREAREVGLDCVLVHENFDFELIVDEKTSDRGIRSTGPDKESLKIVHSHCIKGLTEPNPEWRGEWCEKPMFTKPKDLGFEIIKQCGVITIISAGSRLDQARLVRCRASLVRSVIQSFVFLCLIKNKLQ